MTNHTKCHCPIPALPTPLQMGYWLVEEKITNNELDRRVDQAHNLINEYVAKHPYPHKIREVTQLINDNTQLLYEAEACYNAAVEMGITVTDTLDIAVTHLENNSK